MESVNILSYTVKRTLIDVIKLGAWKGEIILYYLGVQYNHKGP